MDSTLTLNCVIVSKWVFRIIWQACYKLPKVRFLYNTFYRPNEKKQSKFGALLQPSVLQYIH